MFSSNVPQVKLGIVAVSRDCFVIELSERRRHAIVTAYGGDIYECPVTVENENGSVVADAERGLLAAIPLVSPQLTRPIGVIYKRRKVFSAAATEFIEALGGRLHSFPENGNLETDDAE